jgi:hypothetical protein
LRCRVSTTASLYSPDVRWLVRAEEKNWRAAVGGSGLDMQVAHVLTSYRLGP